MELLKLIIEKFIICEAIFEYLIFNLQLPVHGIDTYQYRYRYLFKQNATWYRY
jgi:hypothetical protein